MFYSSKLYEKDVCTLNNCLFYLSFLTTLLLNSHPEHSSNASRHVTNLSICYRLKRVFVNLISSQEFEIKR